MALYKGSEIVAGLSKNTIVTGFNIFDCKWSDHLINDIQWLRADTFSWQSGDEYVTSYNKLAEEWNNAGDEGATHDDDIWYRRTPNGFKIAPPEFEQNILNKYNSDGIAWYYILDTENKRFKLPRTKWGFKGLRDNPGDGIDEKLPNITSEFINHARDYNPGSDFSISPKSGAIYNVGLNSTKTSYPNVAPASSGSYTGDMVSRFDASRSSSTYQDNAPVQERGTQMYLYFYVGEYAQTAIEQTAGLNAELFNNKLDLNASNLSTQGMSYISGLGMPSDRYINLELGASGTTYTAPANGYVYLAKTAGVANSYIFIYHSSYIGTEIHAASTTASLRTFLPVKKGDVFTVTYTTTGATSYFRFIYAEGEQ